jgi:biotin synthase-related radical SAM superfamily protein
MFGDVDFCITCIHYKKHIRNIKYLMENIPLLEDEEVEKLCECLRSMMLEKQKLEERKKDREEMRELRKRYNFSKERIESEK